MRIGKFTLRDVLLGTLITVGFLGGVWLLIKSAERHHIASWLVYVALLSVALFYSGIVALRHRACENVSGAREGLKNVIALGVPISLMLIFQPHSSGFIYAILTLGWVCGSLIGQKIAKVETPKRN